MLISQEAGAGQPVAGAAGESPTTGGSLRATALPPPPPPPPPVPAPAQSSPPSQPPLIALGPDCLLRCLARLEDPSGAAAACRALRAVTASDDFKLAWFAAGGAERACADGAATGGADALRHVAWRAARGAPAGERVRWLLACRRRVRRDARGSSSSASSSSSSSSVSSCDADTAELEASAALAAGRPVRALLRLAGRHAEHLLLPAAARAGDLALLQELCGGGGGGGGDASGSGGDGSLGSSSSDALPLRPPLLPPPPRRGGSARSRVGGGGVVGAPSAAAVAAAAVAAAAARRPEEHLVLLTAARAALAAGRAEAAAWLIARLCEDAGEADVDRTDPACEADPFALLRFACRRGAARCLEAVPQLRAAAARAAEPGAPPALLRALAGAAAARVDAEGPAVCEALLQALPEAERASVAWLMLPVGAR